MEQVANQSLIGRYFLASSRFYGLETELMRRGVCTEAELEALSGFAREMVLAANAANEVIEDPHPLVARELQELETAH